MMSFLASSAAGGGGLRAAKIFGARQFVARVVDHFVGLQLRRRIGPQLINLTGKHDEDKEQEGLQKQRGEHSAVGENAVGSFAGKAAAGAGKGWADGSNELLPARRPFDQELGRVVMLDDPDLCELERFGQNVSVWLGLRGDESELLARLLHLDFNPIAQCSFSSGRRVPG
jgi:hypothetical protein